MKREITLLILVVLLLGVMRAFSQQEIKPIKIGERLPEIFLKEMVNYQSPSVKLSTFKGKALIIDFWATWCGACLDGFPKMDSIQKNYKNDLNIILATSQSKHEISTFLKKELWKRYSFPSATDDKLLKQYFPHFYLPHQIWIDKTGVVRSINNGRFLKEDLLHKFFTGQKLAIPDATNISDVKTANGIDPLILYDYQQYGLENMLSYGYVSKFQKDIKSSAETKVDKKNGTIRLSYKNLHWTTLIAGSLFNRSETFHYPSMVIRKDTQRYKNIDEISNEDTSNYFCFDGILKDTSEIRSREFMHQQIDDAFHIRSFREAKRMRVYVLKEFGNDHKYRNPDNKTKFDANDNLNVNYYVNNLTFFTRTINGSWKLKYPLINEVAFSGKAYFQYDFSSGETEKLSHKLREYGLEIVEEERLLNVLLITDKR